MFDSHGDRFLHFILDPQSPKPWTGIHDAFEESVKSMQFDEFTNELIGGEDCLYLNVAANNLTGKKPVMVWIHGGGFMAGSGSRDLYSPDYLLKHDIVFVSINYRLGIFGFLNMDIQDCPGNQGLKDQVLALKWIQENIEAFGGDKNNVTIFGESAGAAAVHYHCLSPQSKGLFHKAIIQSGVVANTWSYQPSNKKKAFEIAATLGKTTSNPEELVDFLRSVNPGEILQVQERLYPQSWLMYDFNFIPTIDSKSGNPFLPVHPSELMKNDINIPLMIGFNSHESIILLSGEQDNWYTKLNEEFDNILAFDLKQDMNKISHFSKEVKNFYFKDEPITIKHREEFVRYKGDVDIVIGTQYIIERQMQKTAFPTYAYKFSLNIKNSLVKIMHKIDMEGASHTDELCLLFYMPILGKDKKIQKDTADYLAMQRLTKMWTNFAKTGNPTPEINNVISEKWLPVNGTQKFYIEISDHLEMKKNPDDDSWKLWKSFVKDYQLI
ncbi:esterase FE4-like isoform X2 [Belonocnema kinseyi]|uniref:esterase FE4-like isoform X2 n=1 Tax=Belonocnema kinseyi TaxID=2817044 RepID=UPI00143D95FF|nr:esterase FE4-like isoform X2 [Belonocnema kinseyi]